MEFIDSEIIEVQINYNYSEKEKYFKISKKTKIEDNEHYILSDNIKICYNIKDFIQNFPDLILTQKYNNISIFDIEKEIKVGESLNSYFSLLINIILKKFPEEIKEEILLIIEKYIFEKIYFKTFPKYTEVNDQNISNKINSLSWIKPEYFNLYNFDFDLIIPIITDLFKQIEIQRSPFDKLDIISKIFEIIFNALKYIKGEKFSSEDITNICEYIIIKAKPDKIFSNLRYIEIFENKDMYYKNKIYLKGLKENIENILKLNYKSFKGMSEVEFNNKCKI